MNHLWAKVLLILVILSCNFCIMFSANMSYPKDLEKTMTPIGLELARAFTNFLIRILGYRVGVAGAFVLLPFPDIVPWIREKCNLSILAFTLAIKHLSRLTLILDSSCLTYWAEYLSFWSFLSPCWPSGFMQTSVLYFHSSFYNWDLD